ncbi:class I SAM-dependent DNA methyltransferase [Liquorilactobacillus oeni]|nr:class I SAM-dependent methyltransferase [Liquorilactobacillus oeni]
MIYSNFAQLYDDLMEPAIYEEWEQFIARLTGKKDMTILDLACGTGRMAVKLAQEGYTVTGVDLSDEMLALADQRAHSQKLTIPLLQANMTDLSELAQFDMVISCLDSLCYLQNPQELKRVFLQVAQHLPAGGLFVFDVISPYQTDKIYPGYTYSYTNDEQAFTWESYSGEQRHSVIHDLNFFVEDKKTKQYERFTEIHHERTYEADYYLKLLLESGFYKAKVFGNFGREEIKEQTTRFFFVCHKK